MPWCNTWKSTTVADEMYDFPPHIHKKTEILLVEEGSSKIRIGSKEFSLNKGQLVIIPPLEVHVFTPLEYPYSRVGMSVDCAVLSTHGVSPMLISVFKNKPADDIYVIDTNEVPEVRRLILALHGENKSDQLLKQEMLAILLQEMLLKIYRAFPHRYFEMARDSEMERARAMIEKELQCPISVRSLASLFYMTESHFIVRFKKYTGFTPHQYRSLCQIVLARQLLADDSIPLCEIADRCGFGELNSFVRRFRAIMHVSPGKYRKLAGDGHFGS